VTDAKNSLAVAKVEKGGAGIDSRTICTPPPTPHYQPTPPVARQTCILRSPFVNG
jgi:hypothetical protein